MEKNNSTNNQDSSLPPSSTITTTTHYTLENFRQNNTDPSLARVYNQNSTLNNANVKINNTTNNNLMNNTDHFNMNNQNNYDDNINHKNTNNSASTTFLNKHMKDNLMIYDYSSCSSMLNGHNGLNCSTTHQATYTKFPLGLSIDTSLPNDPSAPQSCQIMANKSDSNSEFNFHQYSQSYQPTSTTSFTSFPEFNGRYMNQNHPQSNNALIHHYTASPSFMSPSSLGNGAPINCGNFASSFDKLQGPLSASIISNMSFNGFVDYSSPQAIAVSTNSPILQEQLNSAQGIMPPTLSTSASQYGSWDSADYSVVNQRFASSHANNTSYSPYPLDLTSPVGSAPHQHSPMMMHRSFSEQLRTASEYMVHQTPSLSSLNKTQANHLENIQQPFSNMLNNLNANNKNAENFSQSETTVQNAGSSTTSIPSNKPPTKVKGKRGRKRKTPTVTTGVTLPSISSISNPKALTQPDLTNPLPIPPSRLSLQIPLNDYFHSPTSPQVLSALTPSHLTMPPTPTHSPSHLSTPVSAITGTPQVENGSSSDSPQTLTGCFKYSTPAQPEEGLGKRFVCPHPGCSKTFPRQYNLKSHMLCHSGVKPHVCNLCKAAFARKHDLHRHVRTLHSGNRPHVCPLCKQGFNRLESLRKHLKSEEKAHLNKPEIRELLLSIEVAKAAEEEALKKKSIEEEQGTSSGEVAATSTPTSTSAKIDTGKQFVSCHDDMTGSMSLENSSVPLPPLMSSNYAFQESSNGIQESLEIKQAQIVTQGMDGIQGYSTQNMVMMMNEPVSLSSSNTTIPTAKYEGLETTLDNQSVSFMTSVPSMLGMMDPSKTQMMNTRNLDRLTTNEMSSTWTGYLGNMNLNKF